MVRLLLGGAPFALSYSSRRRGAATETGPTTDGTVTHAERRRDSPHVEDEYEYDVDGRLRPHEHGGRNRRSVCR